MVMFGSPVSKAMLSPHFREGVTLRRESQVTIPLPEDNANAMLTILNAMHMRFPSPEDPVTTSDLVDIAQLCDKYRCTKTMWPLTRAKLVLSTPRHINDPAGAGDTLVASTVLGDRTMTQKLGWYMLAYFIRKMQCSPKGSTILPLLATNIFGKSEHALRSAPC
jgi:hypothetical protein